MILLEDIDTQLTLELSEKSIINSTTGICSQVGCWSQAFYLQIHSMPFFLLGIILEGCSCGLRFPSFCPIPLCPSWSLHAGYFFSVAQAPANYTNMAPASTSWTWPLDSSNTSSSMCSLQVRGDSCFPLLLISLGWLFGSFYHLTCDKYTTVILCRKGWWSSKIGVGSIVTQ